MTFLQLVAADLIGKYGNNLSGLTVVFPGKRASLFLDQALAEVAAAPVWAPRYQTISELFCEASPYKLCDRVEAVCRLYKAYAECMEEPWSLDQFYGWGEILLSDFDDMDKHLVDAERLFRNIRDIKEMDTNDHILDEQEKALAHFFKGFSLEANSALKERFLHLWSKMWEIYKRFNSQMRADGILYEGALQRAVVEDHSSIGSDEQTYIFVGFNVLNSVEEAVFDTLNSSGRASFYWDYDNFYVNNASKSEAGYFIARNLERYGNALPRRHFDSFCAPKEMVFAASSSENAQARYMPDWLKRYKTTRENRTAILLCNEQLLAPVLHAIPPTVNNINVTMGYPLGETTLFGFLNSLIHLLTEDYDAQRNRFRADRLKTLREHPYANLLFENLLPEETDWLRPISDGADMLSLLLDILSRLGRAYDKTAGENPDMYTQLAIEAIFISYTRLQLLYNLYQGEQPLLTVSLPTLRRLIKSMLQTQSIPFHGEPAIGVQIMGMLETRCLDFDNILMLSVGEGFLPRGNNDITLIPYQLKEAYGMTTSRHRNSVYAYYFFRVIQRAKHITFVFNQSNAGTRQNEMSRFLRQLLAETDFEIKHIQLEAGSTPDAGEMQSVEKTPEIMALMYDKFDCSAPAAGENRHKKLTPTALNIYASCPMRFYYQYILGLKASEEEEDIDNRVLGNIVHDAADAIYTELKKDGPVQSTQIEPLLDRDAEALYPYIDASLSKQKEVENSEHTGKIILVRKAAHDFLRRLLTYDRECAPIEILDLEGWHNYNINVLLDNGREILVQTGGKIDRLDKVVDKASGLPVIRVVDYKTGSPGKALANLEAVFKATSPPGTYNLQTILYCIAVSGERAAAGIPVLPHLIYVRSAAEPSYNSRVSLGKQPFADVREIAGEFNERLCQRIADLFDPSQPFTRCQTADPCKFCDFASMCNRTDAND
ncbi:MAG: PD-(D/E)XK nuclease family protein [Bacteroidaceae bacterium]|nr:PD-(D/E)XK nuclease family protein [Bacteroidaceae bacterium]